MVGVLYYGPVHSPLPDKGSIDLHAIHAWYPVALGLGTVCRIAGGTACQWDAGTSRCEGVARFALLIADALTRVIIGCVWLGTPKVAHAFALAAIEDLVSGAPGVVDAPFHALTFGHVEGVTCVACWLVWAHAAAGVFVEDLRQLARRFVWADALALGLIVGLMNTGALCLAFALTLAGLAVEFLEWSAECFLADA